jgi:hypothetical protein
MLTTILMSLTATMAPIENVSNESTLGLDKFESVQTAENRRTSTKKLSYTLTAENRRTSTKKLSYQRTAENRRTSTKKL